MTEEKNIDANNSQDKSYKEHLSDDKLENVVGGVCGKAFDDTKSYGIKINSDHNKFDETGR